MEKRVEISFRTIILSVTLVLGLWVAFIIRELFYALFLAYIFMSALKPSVAWLESKLGFKRKIASISVVGIMLLLVGYISSFVFPPIIHETALFLAGLPALIVAVAPNLSTYIDASSITTILPNLTQNLLNIVGSVFSNLFFVVSVVFFTLYFLLDPNFIAKILEAFFPDKTVARVVEIAKQMEIKIGAWVSGELILMTVIGVFSYIGLTILGVKYALSLAFLAGILEVVPMVGPIISAIPAILVSATTSWVSAGMVVGLYVIIQQFENNLIVPYVMSKTVGLSPLLTLIALSIGGKVGGVMGVILAVPVMLCVEVVLKDLFPGKKKVEVEKV